MRRPDGEPWTLETFTAGAETTRVWSVVWLSELRGEARLDAEFWQPQYLQTEQAILAHRWESLENLAISIRKGVFYILASEYSESGIPFYRSSNVGEIVPADHSLAYISPQKHREEAKTALTYGDIMLAKTGQERASVVLREQCNISQDVIGIQLRKGAVNPFYLATYLNTWIGKLQMLRWFQGQAQPHLSLPGARRILVPLPLDDFQADIEASVCQSNELVEHSKALYAEAEALLLAELGLDDLDLSHQPTYARDFSRAWAAGRLDAEYFQPKYQRAMEIMGQSGKTIGDVAWLAKRRFEPKPGKPFQYIEIGNVGRAGHAEGKAVPGEEAPSRAQWVVRAGDVITSTVRPIRRLSALIEPEQDGYVCSSGFAVLKPTAVEPEVLLVYLRLPVVCEILDLRTSASMYPAISTTNLLSVPITVPADKVRARMVKLIQESRRNRQEARRLLEEAKRRVKEMVLGEES